MLVSATGICQGMDMLNRRLQVLIDDERHERLRREAERTGMPVGELVRRAIDRQYPPVADRRAAGEYLLGLEAPAGPEPAWEVQKDMLAEFDRRREPGIMSGEIRVSDDFDGWPPDIERGLGIRDA